MKSGKKTTRSMVLSAMLVGISVVLMMISAVLGSGRLATLALLSMTPVILLSQKYWAISWAGYAATLLCGLLMVPDKAIPLAYGLFFGLYPFLWQLTQSHLPRPTGWLLRWIAFCAGYGLFLWIFASRWNSLPLIGLIAAGHVAFALYDWMYGRCVAYFMARWAPTLEKWEKDR